MNIKNVFILMLTAISLASCSAVSYYQVYTVDAKQKNAKTKTNFAFEDENCLVRYNFWSKNGDAGFVITNKSTENMYLNLDKCFFVKNGFAYDYYKNRTSSYSIRNTIVNGNTQFSGSEMRDMANRTKTVKWQKNTNLNSNSSGYSVSYAEARQICIPPGCSKQISEYPVNDILYRDCNLYRFPTAKQINSITFNAQNSPFMFSNIISYTKEGETEAHRLKTDFFISEICNYPKNKIVKYKYTDFCGEKSSLKSAYITQQSFDKFYLIYLQTQDRHKH